MKLVNVKLFNQVTLLKCHLIIKWKNKYRVKQGHILKVTIIFGRSKKHQHLKILNVKTVWTVNLRISMLRLNVKIARRVGKTQWAKLIAQKFHVISDMLYPQRIHV